MKMDKFKKMNSKEDKYIKAKDAYYNNVPIMDDYEFDKLEEELTKNNSDVVGIVGAPVKGLRNKKQHITPMLSLNKFNFTNLGDDDFKSFSNFLKNFIKNIPKQDDLYLEFSVKYDGNGINFIYENGELVNILTRGDGKIGNDITSKLFDISLKSIPHKHKNVEIRAEVVIPMDKFNNAYSENSKNARNYVTGILNSLKDNGGSEVIQDLRIQPVEVRYLDNNGDINWIQDSNILINPILKIEYSEFEKFEDIEYLRFLYDNYFLPARFEYAFMVDGIVCKIVSRNNSKFRGLIGETQHHPKWAFAIKFPAVKKYSKINSIEWSMSKTGEFIPIINIEPIDIDGSVVSKCSGHNWGYLANNKKWGGKVIGVGSTVLIEKAGDIIPAIVDVTEFAGEKPKLDKCPFCNSDLIIADNLHLNCENYECPEKKFQLFSRGVDIFEIPFLGESMKRKFFNIGIQTPLEIFINKDKLNGDNKDSANIKKIKDHLNTRREYELYKVIISMGIRDCGIVLAKELAKKFSGMEYSTRSLQKSVFEDFDDNYKEKLSKYILDLHNVGIDILSHRPEENIEFCFEFEMTGSPSPFFKTKSEVCDFMKQYGGKQCGRFDKDTKYLFTDDLNSETSKMKKANKLNIEILSYESLINHFKK